MTKPKLLIAADTYFPKKDGVVRFLKEVVPRLAGDFQLTLIVPNFEHKKIEIIKNKTSVIKLPVSKIIGISGYQGVKYSLKNRKTIKKYVRESDFVFIQDLALVGQLSLKYARKFNKPVFTYIHQINWEQLPPLLPGLVQSLVRKIVKRFSIRKYNQCDLIFVPYKTLGRELENTGIKSPKKVVRLGVNSKTFRPPENREKSKKKFGISPELTVIGYVGRISDEKNLDVLIETFQKLREKFKNIFLLIVGGGSENKIKKIQATRNTKVTGFVSSVVPYLQAMDIFVMPSLTETTSLATLEAMSCGVPVVTTKVGFLKEYVVKNYNGLLFPKGNPYNLNLQLRKLLQNPKLRKTMGENARSTARSFSWENTASTIKKIIEKI